MNRMIQLVLVMAVAALSSPSQAERLEVATGEFVPFTGADLPGDGVVNQVVRRMAEDAGFDVDFVYGSWSRALETTRRGRHHATSYWAYAPEYREDFILVGPIVRTRVLLFYLDGTTIPEGGALAALGELRIGATTNYTYTDAFDAMAESGALSVERASDDVSSFRKLLAGRIDAFPMSEIPAWALLRETFAPEELVRIRTAPIPLRESDGFLLVSRAQPNAEETAARLQAGFDALAASGEAERILGIAPAAAGR